MSKSYEPHIPTASPAVVAARGGGSVGRNDTELARLYNLNSAIIVWRTSITPVEYRAAVVWTEVDALAVGKARIWEWLTVNMAANINAADSAVRQGIADAWASNSATRPALLAVAKRAATVAESVYQPVGTDATPGTLVVEGQLTINNLGDAFRA
jgi:hypothetical protein